MSLFELFWLDLAALVKDFKQEFIDGLTANLFTKAEPPTCQGQSEARGDGYSINSSSTGTVFWCFGLQNSKRELVAVNNRDYVLAVQHPGLSVITIGKSTGIWGKLAQLVSETYNEMLIFPSEDSHFGVSLQAGKQGGIKTQADPASELLYSLETGVSSMLAIVTHFGTKSSGSKILDTTEKLLSKAECFDTMTTSIESKKANTGVVLASCFNPDELRIALAWMFGRRI